jgi:hypothetical protein
MLPERRGQPCIVLAHVVTIAAFERFREEFVLDEEGLESADDAAPAE